MTALACTQGGTTTPVPTPVPVPTPTPAPTSFTASKSTDNTLTTLNSVTLDKCVAQTNYSLVYAYAASQTSTVSNTTEDGFETASVSNDRLAQTFIAPATGTMVSLKLKLSAPVMNTAATVSIRERGVVGQLRAMNSINDIDLSTPSMLDFTMPTAVSFEKNKTYAIIVQTGTGPVRWYRSSSGGGIAGEAFSSADASATWTVTSAADFNFELVIKSASETWQYSYNGVSSTAYTSYPASQIININGREAGTLNFTTNPTAPVAVSATDTVGVTAN